MLKHIAPLAFAFALGGVATAQNAEQINQVQGGQSCAGCNLFQADMSYRDISGVDVSGSRLIQSDFSLATADRVNFEGANLSISNLFGGRFTSANFRKANLERATLVGGYFGSADFTGASLASANLSGADLETARGLTQAQLDRTCGDRSTSLPKGLRIPACR